MLISHRDIDGVGLGTAPFAFRDGSLEDSVATVHAALDAGVELIDAALAYTRPDIESYAEAVVAIALRGIANPPLVATKGGHWREGDRFPVDGRPETLRAHCEVSLRSLDVERIDLYQLHHVDPEVPLVESIAALAAMQAEGLIGAIGLSNVTEEQLDEATAVAEIASVQNRLSYARPDDLRLAQLCAERGIAYLAYMPFDGGGAPVAPPIEEVARRREVSPQRVMVGWLRAMSPSIVPLVGASRPASIADSADLLDLTSDDLYLLGSGVPGR